MSLDSFMPLHALAFCLVSTVTSASLLISVWLGNGVSIQVSAELSSFSKNNGVLYFYKLVYQDSDYVGVVSRCTAQLMARAAIEVKALPHYITDGEVFSLCGSHASIVWIMHLLSCMKWLNCYHFIFGDSVTDLVTGDALRKDLQLQLLGWPPWYVLSS